MNALDTTALGTENRFLTGLFAPVTEEITAFDLPVTGRLPAELNGRYLRRSVGTVSQRTRCGQGLLCLKLNCRWARLRRAFPSGLDSYTHSGSPGKARLTAFAANAPSL